MSIKLSTAENRISNVFKKGGYGVKVPEDSGVPQSLPLANSSLSFGNINLQSCFISIFFFTFPTLQGGFNLASGFSEWLDYTLNDALIPPFVPVRFAGLGRLRKGCWDGGPTPLWAIKEALEVWVVSLSKVRRRRVIRAEGVEG